MIPKPNSPHIPRLRSCKHTFLNIAYYAAFFLKKDGTKKDFRASSTGPEAYPLRCPNTSRGGLRHICRFVRFTKWGFVVVYYLSPAPTRSDIGDVILRLFCSRYVWLSPNAVGATIGRPKTNASHYPHGYSRYYINRCRGDSRIVPRTNASRKLHGYVRNVCLLPIGSFREGAPA